ncbi:pyridoxamine 5'-phosphate oxidase-domain-containing protein [Syncephalastrum racemosum]|uniref:Pyridoxamine 5'-phosphate oxidase-domain-containing protein n=1 Tax=Syncephalastrum racemosum TaxID=13706 RepID=A0A1X2HTZ5_SYNRA|nr:pyridoxamine 5'-phosphate oxidase-domain-containing protein [Syncephalastrum racemosum]
MSISPSWKKLIATQLQINFDKLGPPAAYVSLATVRPDNTPANRTVVFRGFAGEDHKEATGWESDLLVMTCDKRSPKMSQITSNSAAEICWYFHGTQEQFRISGKLHIVADGDPASIKPLDEHVCRVSSPDSEKISWPNLAFRNALKQFGQDSFSWQAERLRQWYRMSPELRATFTWPTSKERGEGEDWKKDVPETLNIEGVDEETGWCKGDPKLEDGYKNFVLLIMEATKIDHVLLQSGDHRVYRL